MKKYLSALLVLCAALGLIGCSTPAARLDAQAERLGFERALVRGESFAHVIYRHRVPTATTLHVYLEGDGTPWMDRETVAPDPTPRQPLMLTLMGRDRGASLYLGRPCYNGLATSAGCTPLLWTHERYSEAVVHSMAAVLRRELEAGDYRHLALFGHSGGGTLAMLLAARFAETDAVVTIAGNLDPAAWAAWHDYSPLRGSLNPTQRPALAPRIRQFHYVGAEDTQVPPALIEAALRTQPGAVLNVVAGADHRCCWDAQWDAILARLAALTAASDR